MKTFERARAVQRGMESGTGARYLIWFDPIYQCFRVLPQSEHRPGLVKVEQ